MTNDKKQQFIGKWSNWFISHKHAKELLDGFEKELDELIQDEQKENQPTTGMTEAEFELAKQGAKVESIEGIKVRAICFDAGTKQGDIILLNIYDTLPAVPEEPITKQHFMQNFRLRTTKREGWVCFVPEGNKIYATKEGAQDRCEIAGGVPARITWNEPKKEE